MGVGEPKGLGMQDAYDRKKCVALIKEALEITHHLKAETESIRSRWGECSKATPKLPKRFADSRRLWKVGVARRLECA